MTGRRLIDMTEDDLLALFRRALRDVLAERDAAHNRPMSATRAARRAKVRNGTLIEALAKGELRGEYNPKSHGGRGAWAIQPADLAAWASSLVGRGRGR